MAYRFNLPAQPSDELRAGYRFMAETARAHGRLPVFLSRASETLDPEWFALFQELDAPFLMEYERSLRAMAALMRRRGPAQLPPAPAIDQVRRAKARACLTGPMTHARTAALLDLYRIPRAPEALVRDADAVADAAARIGFPVALKLVSPDLPHKSEADALRLGVSTAGDAVRAYHELIAAAGDIGIEGVLVQRMERGVAECIVGIQHDPEVGSVVLAGLGGIFVEVFDDVALRLPPVDHAGARAMLASLRGAPLLEGARGRPVADRDALADIVERVSQLACEVGDLIGSIDLNPVIVRADGAGAVVVDALATLR
jgi:acyl-CoA synthetase (NDP forming)